MEKDGTRKRLITAIIAAAVVIAGLIFFGITNRPHQTPPTTDSANPRATTSNQSKDVVPAPSDRMMVLFTQSGFQPARVTVKKGSVVTIKNDSNETVQFSSDDHPTHRKNPEMNLRPLGPGESASYTATKVGEWGYHDHLHADKTGTITVTE